MPVPSGSCWSRRCSEPALRAHLLSRKRGSRKLVGEYLASKEFEADMKGFDSQDIVDVETILLDAAAASPIQGQSTW